MTMRKRLLSLLLLLPLALGLGVYSAAASEYDTIENKTRYQTDPLYINLDLDPNNDFDNENFVVMKEGSVILYADSGMRMEASDDGRTYKLYNPSEEAKKITAGTPVAFINTTATDPKDMQTFFFLPQHVSAGTECVVFSCDPDNVAPKQLFKTIGIDIKKDIPFRSDIDYSTLAQTIKVSGTVSGTLHIDVFYNLIKLETENWVTYNLENIDIEIGGNFQQEIPILKIPIAGVPYLGLEVGIGLGIFVEGDTEITFDMEDGKAGFKLSLPAFHKPSFENRSQQPNTEVKEIIAEGDFELDVTLGPSIDAFGLFAVGCDLAAGIEVKAALTGDEGGRGTSDVSNVRPVDPSKWHVCKELSCLQGEIDVLVKVEAWVQIAKSVYSASYDFARQKYGDFHYSFTFDEFALEKCKRYLYLVEVKVVEEGTTNPMQDVTVEYTPLMDLSDRRGEDYIKGKTDEKGTIDLYMPEGEVKITATSWQDNLDPEPGGKVHNTVAYVVSPDGGTFIHQVEIPLPLYHYMELVYFEENANGETVENMPNPFWVEEKHTGTIPNEVPRRVNWHFVEWNTKEDGSGERYFPGDEITVVDENIQLFAIWTSQPATDFRTITYDPNGENVVLADNPQIYFKNDDGTILINPTRQDYVFTGWTCKEIGLTEPQLQVTVQCSDPDGNDYVHRTYVAHWKHVTYNVIWRNWDGSWLDISRDLYNVKPTYEGPNPPVRPSDDSYFYVFAGWTPEIKVVTEDAEYTAVYNAEPLPTAGQPVVPPTGDGFPLEAVLALMALSAGALLLLARLAKRRNA